MPTLDTGSVDAFTGVASVCFPISSSTHQKLDQPRRVRRFPTAPGESHLMKHLRIPESARVLMV
jgi:hypothetical protein